MTSPSQSGCPPQIDLPEGYPFRPQAKFADEVALDRYRGGVQSDGVAALIECIMRSPEPITVITIGPVTDLAAALAIEPAIATKARLIGMLGSVRHGAMDTPGPVPEYNVAIERPCVPLGLRRRLGRHDHATRYVRVGCTP